MYARLEKFQSKQCTLAREEHFTWREFDRHCSDTVQSLLFVMIYSFNMVTLSARSLRHEDKISQFVWRRMPPVQTSISDFNFQR